MTVCVVIADPGDDGAASLVGALSARGVPAAAIEPARLGLARWVHVLDARGRASTVIDLPDGRRLADGEIGAVLCRSASFPMARFTGSAPADRDYATAEFLALVVSWLRGLGDRVVNDVDGVSSIGPTWTGRRALVEAQRAGLPIVTSVVATSGRLVPGFSGSPYAARMPWTEVAGPPVEHVLVTGSQAFGRLADRFGAACTTLAERVRCRLLEVSFAIDEAAGADAYRVSSVSPVPALREAWGIEAVARLLESIAEPTVVSAPAGEPR